VVVVMHDIRLRPRTSLLARLLFTTTPICNNSTDRPLGLYVRFLQYSDEISRPLMLVFSSCSEVCVYEEETGVADRKPNKTPAFIPQIVADAGGDLRGIFIGIFFLVFGITGKPLRNEYVKSDHTHHTHGMSMLIQIQ
jgi:hypothetical protein